MTYYNIYNRGPVVTLKDRGMLSLRVASRAPARVCATFVNVLKTVPCSQRVWRQIAPPPLPYLMPLVLVNCLQDGNTWKACLLLCSSNQFWESMLSGKTDSVYVSEAPPHLGSRERSLVPDRNGDLHLFSPAEHVSLTIFVMPAMVTYLSVEISRWVCAVAKALNATS